MNARPLPGGVGLGLRAAFAGEILAGAATQATFLEVAPENYLGVGGARRRILHAARERFALSAHGLCGDFAGAAPIDEDFVASLRGLLQEMRVPFFSDHLCFTHLDGAEVHDLIPLPHTPEAATRAATRIRALTDRLALPLAIENASAVFRTPGGSLDEVAFLRAVLDEADCGLLLDVNNVWVNAQNFGFDPFDFIRALPLERVVELHVAGGEHDADADCWIDTHGADTPDPVLALLSFTLDQIARPVPVLLERDHNIPALPALEHELGRVAGVVARATAGLHRRVA